MADALAYLRQRQENGGFNELLGLRVQHIRPGYAEIVLPANENNLNPLGNAHGGAIYALCDVAARLLFAPYELPVGIVMSFLGCPFFLYLLIRRKGGHAHA